MGEGQGTTSEFTTGPGLGRVWNEFSSSSFVVSSPRRRSWRARARALEVVPLANAQGVPRGRFVHGIAFLACTTNIGSPRGPTARMTAATSANGFDGNGGRGGERSSATISSQPGPLKWK